MKRLLLSIESSCDDSSLAVTDIDTKALLFHKKISQELEHSRYGGVVPELASRLHAEALPKILKECHPYLDALAAVAVTNRPGLAVTLMEGVIMAKALAVALNLPLIGVDHLKGHIYSQFIEQEAIAAQTVLLISGGHTQIIDVKAFDAMEVVASTGDDSFGESFDKVAKMMGLGYPGGPLIEALAAEGDAYAFDFTVPLAQSPRLEFSYSGLKNAVRLAIEKEGAHNRAAMADVAASFQRVATEHLIQKTKKYLKKAPRKPFAIVGGASANLYVRNRFEALCSSFEIPLSFAPLHYCSDNAAMIGRCAVEQFERGDFEAIDTLSINPKAKNFN